MNCDSLPLSVCCFCLKAVKLLVCKGLSSVAFTVRLLYPYHLAVTLSGLYFQWAKRPVHPGWLHSNISQPYLSSDWSSVVLSWFCEISPYECTTEYSVVGWSRFLCRFLVLFLCIAPSSLVLYHKFQPHGLPWIPVFPHELSATPELYLGFLFQHGL